MKKNAREKSDDGELRRRFMLELPLVIGLRWANDSCREMALEGRRVEGGWPGTMPEARLRVYRELTVELAAVALSPPSDSELASATTTAYERARLEWQRCARQASRVRS